MKIVLHLLAATLIAGCSSLPSLENRSISTAALDTDATRLGRAISPRVAANPGKSGIYPLLDSRDAFAARMLLAQAAERTLDVQYYIWHNDLSGGLLFKALHEAAGRGVRVRLLLDDNNTSGLDPILAALDAHPNIEVRLFNPFVVRSPRALGYLTDFFRLNRRMHNKSFTADNQATIIGGRNIGDEYFDATDGTVFVDLDVLAVGPVAKAVSVDFDRYWASGSSYPVDRLLPRADRPFALEPHAAAAAYVDAVRGSPFVRELLEGRLALEWAATRMVSDDPAKGLGRATSEVTMLHSLKKVIGDPASEAQLVSAYFVPAEAGTRDFVDMARRGVKLTILTNSLEATDVAPVHAGYAKRRNVLLEAGITLYEMRRLSSDAGTASAGPFGSSASSLHAKTLAVDRARVFVGSFNFDPRSAHLNTEMGFVIESPALARKVAESFDTRVPERAYRVHLANDGGLYWTERRGAVQIRHDTEPGTSFWRRSAVRVLSLLPIEWLL